MSGTTLFFIGQSLLVYLSIFFVHALRKKITIAPFYVLLGALVWVMWWVTDAGIKIELFGLPMLVGSTVYYSAIISGLFIVYLFDGPRAMRRSIVIVICVTFIVPVTSLVIRYHSFLDPASNLAYVPIPDFRVNAASCFATVVDLVFLVYCWSYLSRESFRIPLWCRSFCTLLAIMWCDALVFGTGAFWGADFYWMYIKSTVLARFIVLSAIFPLIWLYIKWQSGADKTRVYVNSPREVFFGIIDLEYELQVARKELDDHKIVEELIRANERRYRRLFEYAPVALWEEDFSSVKDFFNALRSSGVKDFSKHLNDDPDVFQVLVDKIRILDVNQAALDLHHAESKAHMLGNFAQIFCPESIQVFKAAILAVAEDRLPFESEGVVQTFGGEKRYIVIKVGSLESEWRDYSRTLVVTQDITERKQAEEELHYRSTIETAIARVSTLFVSGKKVSYNSILSLIGESFCANRAYIFQIQRDGHTISNSFEWCSTEAISQIAHLQNMDLKIFPWWVDQLRNGNNIIITNPELLPVEAAAEKALLETQQIKSLISVPIWSKGRELWGFLGLDDTKIAREWIDIEVEALQMIGEMISNDIERRMTTERLDVERKQLLSIFDSIDEFIYISDPHTHEILYVNQTLKNTLAKDPTGELCYKELQSSDKPCVFCTNETILRQKPIPHRWEFYNNTIDKTLDIVDRIIQWPDGRDVRFELAIDISTRKILEQKLQQAGKMEAIGTLAGGIAHDFNNILAAMLGYTELARGDCPYGSSVARDLDKVMEAGSRAKDLVQRILAFSRQDVTKRILLQPAAIVAEVLKILRPSIPVTIDIRQNIASDTGFILADPTQIHQILMNLCTNAFHAMEKTGGTLEITLKEVVFDSNDPLPEPGFESGTFVQLSVCDTGPGIDQEIKNRIFEPYFTTKETGKGTGMGLSIVHGIVKSYGGFVSCSSEQCRGATFDVFLPVVAGTLLSEIVAEEQLPKGKEKILFVDDEKMLAEMGKDMLEPLGYRVTVSNNSLEALEIFKKQADQFDLVITDQTMPHMTGAKLASEMMEFRPDIPIILCTGYSSIISEEEAKSIGIKEFVLKPLLKKDLSKLVKKVLHS